MNFFVSPFLKAQTKGRKVAYIALFTALATIANMFLEIRIYDIQFSLTIIISCINGVFLGPLFGFLSCYLGDLIGYFVNSFGQLYMPWVGISTGMFAFLAGLTFANPSKNTCVIFIKAAIFTLSTFLICTIAINSTGFYLYNRKMGFSDAVLSYVEKTLGSKSVGFLAYLLYRLVFKGQIFNSIFNYVILFLLLPILKNIKVFKDKI